MKTDMPEWLMQICDKFQSVVEFRRLAKELCKRIEAAVDFEAHGATLRQARSGPDRV